MRGDERTQDGMFSYVSLEQRVPGDHPLRAVRKLTDGVLGSLSAEFDALYAASGRPSIAPEYILRALLLQVFYSVRSERLLVEQIDYNLLFRCSWPGMTMRCGTMRCFPRPVSVADLGCGPAIFRRGEQAGEKDAAAEPHPQATGNDRSQLPGLGAGTRLAGNSLSKTFTTTPFTAPLESATNRNSISASLQ